MLIDGGDIQCYKSCILEPAGNAFCVASQRLMMVLYQYRNGRSEILPRKQRVWK